MFIFSFFTGSSSAQVWWYWQKTRRLQKSGGVNHFPTNAAKHLFAQVAAGFKLGVGIGLGMALVNSFALAILIVALALCFKGN